jgi:hypothetical protein
MWVLRWSQPSQTIAATDWPSKCTPLAITCGGRLDPSKIQDGPFKCRNKVQEYSFDGGEGKREDSSRCVFYLEVTCLAD